MNAVYRLVRQQSAGRGRTAVMLAVGALVVLVAVLGAVNGDLADAAGRDVVDRLALTVLLPIVSLLVATASLGEMRESGTLVYLFARPIPRSRLALGSLAAVLSRALPLAVGPAAVAGTLLGGVRLGAAALVAAALGTLAYASLFLLAGLRSKRAVLFGLVYIALWEGVVAGTGTGPARLAVHTYTRSLLDGLDGASVAAPYVPVAAAVLVLLLVTVGGLALTTRVLQRTDVDG